jgi:hypothetical protein
LWLGGLLAVGGLTGLRADYAADLARVNVEASGGLKAMLALRSFRAEGITRVEGRDVPFVLHAARPNKLHVVTGSGENKLIRAVDGLHAPWKKQGARARPSRLEAGEEREFLQDADYDSVFFLLGKEGISLDYAGEERREGRVFHKLLATVRHQFQSNLYLDGETNLLVRREEVRRIGGRVAVLTTVFSDYQVVGGVMTAMRITTTVDGRELSDTRITAVDPNPGLALDFFTPPVADWPKL